MKIVAIIQARMGSTRLPGKVMMTLEDKTVLAHVISRVSRVSAIDQIIIATSQFAQDDIIQKEATLNHATCFRGSETNVLERYHMAAKQYAADVIIRITSDCPLMDSVLLSEMINSFISLNKINHSIDYLSNCLTRTYPRGLDIEIFTMQALSKAYKEAVLDFQREHVTPYIYQHPTLFALHDYVNNCDLSRYRWTLDTAEDFEFISAVYRELYPSNHYFTTNDVLNLLGQKPWLVKINENVEQKVVV